MNKIILVGNGFDISHGLETRYSEFMKNYLSKNLKLAYHREPYDDRLINIEVAGKIYDDADLTKYLNKFNSLRDLLNDRLIKSDFKKNLEEGTKLFHIKTNSALLKRLLKKFDDPNWVDIESEYYQYLNELNNPLDTSKYGEIKKLNSDLRIISNELKIYLKDIILDFDFDDFRNNNKEFLDKMKKLIFSRILYSSGTVGAKYEALILNYNYTPTIQQYLNENPHDYPHTLLNLHGQIDDEEVIFGFGHVESPEYNKLKNSGSDEALMGLKLFRYKDRNQYSKFVNFIESGEFEVIVLGHSCGSSDGTTLKKLFESPLCKRITLCHIGIDEHRKKQMAIARHCDTDSALDKIRDFAEEFRFP
jgi:hypothetical protein